MVYFVVMMVAEVPVVNVIATSNAIADHVIQIRALQTVNLKVVNVETMVVVDLAVSVIQIQDHIASPIQMTREMYFILDNALSQLLLVIISIQYALGVRPHNSVLQIACVTN